MYWEWDAQCFFKVRGQDGASWWRLAPKTRQRRAVWSFAEQGPWLHQWAKFALENVARMP